VSFTLAERLLLIPVDTGACSIALVGGAVALYFWRDGRHGAALAAALAGTVCYFL
jgi:hypothetical protein